jgi:hypothetical protein
VTLSNNDDNLGGDGTNSSIPLSLWISRIFLCIFGGWGVLARNGYIFDRFCHCPLCKRVNSSNTPHPVGEEQAYEQNMDLATQQKLDGRFVLRPIHPSTPNGALIDGGQVFTRVLTAFALCDFLQRPVLTHEQASLATGASPWKFLNWWAQRMVLREGGG